LAIGIALHLQEELEALKRDRDTENLRLNGKALILHELLIEALELSAPTEAPLNSFLCPITRDVMTDPVSIEVRWRTVLPSHETVSARP